MRNSSRRHIVALAQIAGVSAVLWICLHVMSFLILRLGAAIFGWHDPLGDSFSSLNAWVLFLSIFGSLILLMLCTDASRTAASKTLSFVLVSATVAGGLFQVIFPLAAIWICASMLFVANLAAMSCLATRLSQTPDG